MKRLFALFLTVAMILTMIVLPVTAQTEKAETPKTCPHCNTPWNACNWSAWVVEEPDSPVPSGHYYLSEDLNITTRYKIGTSDGQTEEYAEDVCLDLRGYDMIQTTADRRAFYVYNYSTLSVMDTEGGGRIVGTGATGNNGAGGTIYACKNATVNLYSGTITHDGAAQKTKDGGVLYFNSGSTFNMYGGIIDATKVSVAVNADTSQYPRGAAMTLYGTVNIKDGLIFGGQAYQGGAIAVYPAGTLNISGGKVIGGNAESHGGCIYSQGTIHISGGEITGGVSGSRAGNLYSSGTKANLTISGGKIYDGHSSSAGGNVTMGGGKCTVSGGFIQGNMQVVAGAVITGNPVIDNNGYEGMHTTGEITVDGLTEGAKIVLRGDNTFTNATTSPNAPEYLEKGWLIPASRYGITVTDGALVGALDDNGYCPHCGEEVTWVPYTPDTCTSGHYYIPAGGVVPNEAARTIAKDVDIVLNFAHGSVKTAAPYTVAGTLSMLSTAGSIGSFYNTSETCTANGRVMSVTGTLNMYDSYIRGGVTTGNGGALYINGGTLNMYGGRIEGGTAANGGAIYMNGTATKVNMHSGIISGGTATAGGGNLYMYRGTFNMNGGLILGGSANAAGNIYNNTSGYLNINGGVIAFGSAAATGGNLRHAATSCVTTMTDGVIYGGTAPDGGNCYVNNGKFTMTGGSMINGVATTGHSGNLYAHAGYYYINKGEEPTSNWLKIGDDNPNDTIPAPLLSGGRAATKGGNINGTGNLTLGDCTIVGGRGDKGDDMALGSKAYFTVEPGFAQKLVLYLDSARVTQLAENRAITNTFCTTLNAELYAENYDMACLLPTAEGQLGLGGAALVEVATGKQTWFMDAQSAADDCEATQYVRLYAPTNTLEINDLLVLDLNGMQLTATGSGTLYGFDTANDTYETFGTATVTGVKVEPAYLAPNGRQYVAVTDEKVISFHRLGISTSNVALRPASSGVYFKGTWKCDSTLQAQIASFGVAVSTKDMPGADFLTDEDTLYTSFPAESFQSGQTMPSVIIENILKEGEDSDARGKTTIYAAAYVLMKDGTAVVSEDLNPNVGGVQYSLYDVTRTVNRIWPRLDETQQNGVKEMYNTHTETTENWGLYNITAAINGTPAVRPLKILTLGHSLALDACHMINLVAAAEGYDQEFIIGTLYYSGCPLYKHVNYLKNDLPEYSLHISSSLTPDTPPNKMVGYTMKMALLYDDWDVIIMQGGVFEIGYDDKYTDGNIQIIKDYVNQHKLNPDAVFGWNMAWAPPTTNSLRDKYPYEPNSYYTSYEPFNSDRTTLYNAITDCVERNIVTDSSFIYLIPSGTVMENALSSYLEETDLHRDYAHASDLSRLMVSYLWYCELAGIDHLDEIKVDAIPVAFFKSTKGTTDRVLTESEKAIILESVNNALAEPWNMTQSQYTQAP